MAKDMHKQFQKLNQDGFASVVIALVLVLILSLMTIAFSQLSRREQKSSLDKQLATQAYYAAETGVNDVIEKIVNQRATLSQADYDALKPTQCLTSTQITRYNLTTSIDSSRGLSYSCIIVDMTPETVDYTNVSIGSERFSTFKTTGALNTLSISWTNSEPGKNTLRSTGGFPAVDAWNSPAVVQTIFTPIGGGSQSELENNTFTVFFYPVTAAANPSPTQAKNTIAYSTADSDQAKIVYVDCPADGQGVLKCKGIINAIPGAATTDSYLIRTKVFYTKSNITIGDARDNSSSLQLSFVDAQAKIDVTGRARDVLKRIKVSSPIGQNNYETPDAIEAQNLCKRILAAPGGSSTTSFAGSGTACDIN